MSNGDPLTCSSSKFLNDFSSDLSHRSVIFFRMALHAGIRRVRQMMPGVAAGSSMPPAI
jgi:hypothetical protein